MHSHSIIGVVIGLAALLCLGVLPETSSASVLRVGRDKLYTLPSQAAAAAQDGDAIEIDAGIYRGDVATWRANHLKIRGVGGRPVLDAQGHAAEQKAIWVITGNDTLVENMEFTGAAVADKNGAGIRQEGPNLTVLRCSFHDNEDGILAGPSPQSDITVENCEFNHNGHGDGQSHNIYIGQVRHFTLRGCFMHNANVGHNVKTRALWSEILFNRITDEDDSTTSYEINVPNGGLCFIIGNLIRRGPAAGNSIAIAYAEEGAKNPQQALYVVNNTFVNDHPNAVFVNLAGHPTFRMVNNLFVGSLVPVAGGGGELSHNITVPKLEIRDAALFDYRLQRGSAAIAAGIIPGKAEGIDLTPQLQYVHPAGLERRPVRDGIDVGAYGWVEAAAKDLPPAPGQ